MKEPTYSNTHPHQTILLFKNTKVLRLAHVTGALEKSTLKTITFEFLMTVVQPPYAGVKVIFKSCRFFIIKTRFPTQANSTQT